jgi:hypothetical protein
VLNFWAFPARRVIPARRSRCRPPSWRRGGGSVRVTQPTLDYLSGHGICELPQSFHHGRCSWKRGGGGPSAAQQGAKLGLNTMNARSSSYWLVLSYRARATARGFQGRTARAKSCVAHGDRLKPQTPPALVSGRAGRGHRYQVWRRCGRGVPPPFAPRRTAGRRPHGWNSRPRLASRSRVHGR